MNPADYTEIGRYLRDSRESLRVTLAQAERALNIRTKYLAALEAGDLDGLPGKTYTRGYIRNYAAYLRLDADKVLDAYALLLGPRTHELFIPEPTLRQNLPTHRLTWLSLGGLMLLYCYWYFDLHDRTALEKTVASPPAHFTQMLEKPLPPMDDAWSDCLNEANVECYITLKARLSPENAVLYDIEFADTSPQNP